jgi:peptidoglycan/xylan/chitin deacetylase (PgdA/CDA1 family)
LHGGRHLNLRRVGAAYMVQDAVSERRMLRRLVPHLAVDLFRPPYGYQTAALSRLLAAQHLTLVLWDVDTRDWTAPGVAYIVGQVERLVRPGSIVLFHDGGGNRRQTVEALAILLPWFRQHHYRLVTVSALLQAAGQ